MGQVNRIPSGFLDLLGVQSLGKNPPSFNDALIPIVDLTELYLAQTLSVHTEDFFHSAVTNQITVRVPEGETWILRSVGLEPTIHTATSMREQWAFSFIDPPRAPSPAGVTEEGMIFTTPLLSVATANWEVSASHTLGAPIALLGGVVLKARVIARDAGATRVARLNWAFNRLNS